MRNVSVKFLLNVKVVLLILTVALDRCCSIETHSTFIKYHDKVRVNSSSIQLFNNTHSIIECVQRCTLNRYCEVVSYSKDVSRTCTLYGKNVKDLEIV